MRGWIGVDLDGTLAEYHGFVAPDVIGPPVPAMVERVKKWLAAGLDVRLVTARVIPTEGGWPDPRMAIAKPAIEAWCLEHLGEILPFGMKDYEMVELWDDRCIAVERNTGKVLGGRSTIRLGG